MLAKVIPIAATNANPRNLLQVKESGWLELQLLDAWGHVYVEEVRDGATMRRAEPVGPAASCLVRVDEGATVQYQVSGLVSGGSVDAYSGMFNESGTAAPRLIAWLWKCPPALQAMGGQWHASGLAGADAGEIPSGDVTAQRVIWFPPRLSRELTVFSSRLVTFNLWKPDDSNLMQVGGSSTTFSAPLSPWIGVRLFHTTTGTAQVLASWRNLSQRES